MLWNLLETVTVLVPSSIRVSSCAAEIVSILDFI